MAPTVLLLAIFLCVCCFVSSFPVDTDSELKKTDAEFNNKAAKLNQYLLDEELTNVIGEGKLLRTKRNVLENGKCAEGYVWYKVKCVTCEKYKQIQDGDDYDY